MSSQLLLFKPGLSKAWPGMLSSVTHTEVKVRELYLYFDV